jgi:hypothetical protein
MDAQARDHEDQREDRNDCIEQQGGVVAHAQHGISDCR